MDSWDYQLGCGSSEMFCAGNETDVISIPVDAGSISGTWFPIYCFVTNSEDDNITQCKCYLPTEEGYYSMIRILYSFFVRVFLTEFVLCFLFIGYMNCKVQRMVTTSNFCCKTVKEMKPMYSILC
jgi:hypothetical protein